MYANSYFKCLVLIDLVSALMQYYQENQSCQQDWKAEEYLGRCQWKNSSIMLVENIWKFSYIDQELNSAQTSRGIKLLIQIIS